MEVYWREGPASVGVNEICRRAGIAKPGLYREFGGEAGLKAAVLDHYWNAIIRPSFLALTAERPFAEVLDQTLAWLTSDRGLPPGCLFARMRTSVSHLDPALSNQLESLREEMRGTYADWFARALGRDEGNPAISPTLAGYLLDTQLMTVQMQMVVGEPPTLVREQARLALVCLLPS